MSVWLCIPSKRPPEEAEKCLSLWRQQGYKIALWRDDVDNPAIQIMKADLWMTGENGYPGYALAVNDLARAVLNLDPSCDWIVAAGDDTEPDMNHTADEIARECAEWFEKYPATHLEMATIAGIQCDVSTVYGRTFGVMQPTGDRWSDAQGVLIERVAGSAWMGRSWCLRANQGKGPLWPEFFHMFADECLQETAKKLGVFWQRPDLIHLHKHWGRPKDDETIGQYSNMPDFLVKANSPAEWRKSKAEFERLKADGFKECMPC